jgi:hypothetical protein
MSEHLWSMDRETSMSPPDRLAHDFGLSAHERLKKSLPERLSYVLNDYVIMHSAFVTSVPGVVFVLLFGKKREEDVLVFIWLSYEPLYIDRA